MLACSACMASPHRTAAELQHRSVLVCGPWVVHMRKHTHVGWREVRVLRVFPPGRNFAVHAVH